MSNTALEYEIDDGSRPRGSLGDFWVKFPVPDEVRDRHREALTAAGFRVNATEEVLMSIDKDGSIFPDHSGSAVLRGYEESIVAHFDGELKALAGQLAAERMNVEFYKYDGDIPEATWGVDLKVPGHMIGSFESAFEEEEDRDAPQEHMLVVHVDENGDVELGQGYDAGVWHDFENELFSEYEDVLKAKAAEMTEQSMNDATVTSPTSDITLRKSETRLGFHHVELPVLDHLREKYADQIRDDFDHEIGDMHELSIAVTHDGSVSDTIKHYGGSLLEFELEMYRLHLPAIQQEADRMIAAGEIQCNRKCGLPGITRPRPGITPPSERRQAGPSVSM